MACGDGRCPPCAARLRLLALAKLCFLVAVRAQRPSAASAIDGAAVPKVLQAVAPDASAYVLEPGGGRPLMRSEAQGDRESTFQVNPRPGRRSSRFSSVQIRPSGALEELDQPPAGQEDMPDPPPDPEIVMDGSVEVKNPAKSASELTQLQEENADCTETTPIHVCFLNYGSYGIKRLHTETWDDMNKLNQLRSDWMAHQNVQRKAILNITFPGSHNSGTFDFAGQGHRQLGRGLAFGMQTQHLNFMWQLQLGIRAFDIRVVHDPSDNRLWIAHGAVVTVLLQDALANISTFLKTHPKEVVVIYAKVDRGDVPGLQPIEERYVQAFQDEEADPTKVPGQMVHSLVSSYFSGGETPSLMTYQHLRKLPAEEMQNPTIKSLVDINARVLYLWESQQVLCTSREECQQTPGWTNSFESLAFGEGQPLGQRQSSTGGTVVEPTCLADSWPVTKSGHADFVVKNIRAYAADLQQSIVENAPACFPLYGNIPKPHQPTLFHNLDAVATLPEQDNQYLRFIIGNARALFTRGEGFNIQTNAERLNYLLLTWFLKDGYRDLYTQPNIIHHDFTSPIVVHRIIEANQEVQECKYAIYCKPTGSCWAQSLYVPGQNECKSEEEALAELEELADSKSGFNMKMFVFAVVMLGGLSSCVGCWSGFVPKRLRWPLTWAFLWGLAGWMGFVLAYHYGFMIVLAWRVATWVVGDLVLAFKESLHPTVKHINSLVDPTGEDGPQRPPLPAKWYYLASVVQALAFVAILMEIWRFNYNFDRYNTIYGCVLFFWWAGVEVRLHMSYYSGSTVMENLSTTVAHFTAIYIAFGAVVFADTPPFAEKQIRVARILAAASLGFSVAPYVLGRLGVEPAQPALKRTASRASAASRTSAASSDSRRPLKGARQDAPQDAPQEAPEGAPQEVKILSTVPTPSATRGSSDFPPETQDGSSKQL